MAYAKAIAVGVVTGLLTSVVVIAVGTWPILASIAGGTGLQTLYVVFKPMFAFIVVLGFAIGFGWEMWRARPRTRSN